MSGVIVLLLMLVAGINQSNGWTILNVHLLVSTRHPSVRSGSRSSLLAFEVPTNPGGTSTTNTTATKTRQRPRISILEYHSDWVCIDKPPGITVHRSKNTPRHQRVLTSAVKRQLGRKVFPVHRLDHRTSGALLFAFDSTTAGILHHDAIRHGTKQYVALLRGRWTYSNTTRIVDRPVRIEENVTKDAITKFTLFATTDLHTIVKNHGDELEKQPCSLVLCQPITGRTHQIRRHARDINHPIVGDSQHGDSKVNRYWREHCNLDRLALHCWTLEFDTTLMTTNGDRECRPHSIIAPLPLEFRISLETCVPSLWKEATTLEPRLLLDPYDVKGGSHGRYYRIKQQQQQQRVPIDDTSTSLTE